MSISRGCYISCGVEIISYQLPPLHYFIYFISHFADKCTVRPCKHEHLTIHSLLKSFPSLPNPLISSQPPHTLLPYIPPSTQTHTHTPPPHPSTSSPHTEAVKALTGRPSGTFILRPHDAKEEEFLCFLSFVGVELEVGEVQDL